MTDTALVLGGGGFTGGAWQTGLLHGLAAHGTDLTTADLIVGTSAGALQGAQLAAGLTPDALYAQQFAPLLPPPGLTIDLLPTLRYLWAAMGARTPVTAARRLGQMALASSTVTQAEVLAAVDSLLGPVRAWPDRPLLVSAVDADTGGVHAFDSGCGVELRLAIAAGCAVPGIWPPIDADGRRWIDGGVRSTVNADLARGYRRVVVVAPVPDAPGPGPSAEQQTAELAADGARTLLIVPDRASRKAFGRNPLDVERRPAAAEAGRNQAAGHAAAAAAVWGR